MMGLYFKFAYKVLIILPWWLIEKFIQYIEWFDAVMLGFLIWGTLWHEKLMDTGPAIAVAVAAGTVFLVLFHFSKIGFYISTVVFSLIWAYLFAVYPASLVPGNKIVYWIVFALIFAGCARLHLYAIRRSAVEKALASEEAAKQAALRRYEAEAEAANQERMQKLRLEFIEQQERLVAQRQSRQMNH